MKIINSFAHIFMILFITFPISGRFQPNFPAETIIPSLYHDSDNYFKSHLGLKHLNDDQTLLSGMMADDIQIVSFAIAPNLATPANQMSDVDMMVTLENVGDEAATAIFTAHTGTIHYAGTPNYTNIIEASKEESPSIGAGETLSDWMLDFKFSPIQEPEFHFVDYVFETPTGSHFDRFYVLITSNIFAKEGTGLIEFNIANADIAPQSETNYTYGNVFYVKTGSNQHAQEIRFIVDNANELAGRTVTTLLYEWDGDTNGNFKADPSEYGGEPLGENSYTFTGNEGGDPVVIYVDKEGSMPFQGGKYYIPALKFESADGQKMYLKASEEVDYTDMIRATAMTATPHYATALDVGNTGTLDLEGFGHDIVPVIQLVIGTQPITVGTKELELSEANVHLSPNPSSDQVNLKLDLQTVSRSVSVNILDTRGKLLLTKQFAQVQKDILEFDISAFSSGTYFLNVKTGTGQRSIPFVVKR